MLKKIRPNSPRAQTQQNNPPKPSHSALRKPTIPVLEEITHDPPPLSPNQRMEELLFFKDTKPIPRWCWSESGQFVCYQKTISDEIEKYYQLYLTVNGESLIKMGLILIDFVKMRSTVKSYKEKRIVRGTWFSKNGGSYEAYEEDVCFKLEALLQHGQFDEIEVSEKPALVVKYVGNGQFKQYRQSKHGKKDWEDVSRGWMGFMIKEGKDVQYMKAKTEVLNSAPNSLRQSSFQELTKSGLRNFDHAEIARETPALARGSYGIVYKGKVRSLGDRVVVIKDMFIKDNKSIEEWARELETMHKTKSAYVAEVYGFTSVENNLIIVMEYFPNGDLFNLLHKKKVPVDSVKRIIMARQILCGVDHLHRQSVLHRDIKSMNILVTENFNCKITDFGMSKIITDDLSIFNTANAGTPLWMAPEVKAGVYGFPADIYSTGLVLYEILEEKIPPWDKSTERIELPAQYYYQRVIGPLIDRNPTLRKTSKEAIVVFDEQLVFGLVDKIVERYRSLPVLSKPVNDDYLQNLYNFISQQNVNYNDFTQ